MHVHPPCSKKVLTHPHHVRPPALSSATGSSAASNRMRPFNNDMSSDVAKSKAISGESKRAELRGETVKPRCTASRAGRGKSDFRLLMGDNSISKHERCCGDNEISRDAQSKVEVNGSVCAEDCGKVVKSKLAESKMNNADSRTLRPDKLIEKPKYARLWRNVNGPERQTSKARNFKPTWETPRTDIETSKVAAPKIGRATSIRTPPKVNGGTSDHANLRDDVKDSKLEVLNASSSKPNQLELWGDVKGSNWTGSKGNTKGSAHEAPEMDAKRPVRAMFCNNRLGSNPVRSEIKTKKSKRTRPCADIEASTWAKSRMRRRELLRTGDVANGKEWKVEAETKVATKTYLGLSKIHPMDYRQIMLLNGHNFGYPTEMYIHFSWVKRHHVHGSWPQFWGPENNGSNFVSSGFIQQKQSLVPGCARHIDPTKHSRGLLGSSIPGYKPPRLAPKAFRFPLLTSWYLTFWSISLVQDLKSPIFCGNRYLL